MGNKLDTCRSARAVRLRIWTLAVLVGALLMGIAYLTGIRPTPRRGIKLPLENAPLSANEAANMEGALLSKAQRGMSKSQLVGGLGNSYRVISPSRYPGGGYSTWSYRLYK